MVYTPVASRFYAEPIRWGQVDAMFRELLPALDLTASHITVAPSHLDDTERWRRVQGMLNAMAAVAGAPSGLPSIKARGLRPIKRWRDIDANLLRFYRGYYRLNAAQTLANWTVASNITQTMKAYPVAAPSGRTNGLSLAKPTTGTFGGSRTLVVPANFKMSRSKLIGLWVYWSADAGSMSLRLTGIADFTRRREFSWAYPGALHKGWNLLTIDPTDAGWTVTGTQPLDETIVGLQLSINTASGVATEIFVDSIFYHIAPPAQGSVMVGFDAWGEESIVDRGLPLFEKHDIRGYWAGDTNLLANPGDLAMLHQVYDAGWDVIQQGPDHKNYVTAGDVVLGTDFTASRAALAATGMTRALDFFAYPLSANNEATDAMLATKGVKMARSGSGWTIHPNPYNKGPKLIGHGGVNMGGKTRPQLLAYVEQADKYGVGMNFYAHGVAAGGATDAAPADTAFVYENHLDEFLGLIAGKRDRGTLWAGPPSEWYARSFV